MRMTSGEDAAGTGSGESLIKEGFIWDGQREWQVNCRPNASSEMTDITTHKDKALWGGAGEGANMTHRVLKR